MLDAQGLQQPLAHDGQRGVQVGLRTQFPGELHQGPAVVVAVAVEMPVQPLLHPVADGLEEERRDQHHGHQAGVAQVLEILFHQGAQREDDAVKRRQHAQGRQGVRVAAAEDDVHVHQPVAHNRVGQRERNQSHAQHAHLHVGIRHRAQHVRQHVKQRERQDPAERSVAQPLQLLAHHHVFGAAVFGGQNQRADQVGQRPGHHPGPVHHPAQFHQRHGDLHGAGTEGHERQEHQGRGHVEQNGAGDAAEPRPRLGKRQAEMQEHGGRQQARHQVAEINHLVEIVELAGVVEAQRNETRQAQNIKMPRLLRAAPPEVDEQPDHQVSRPHRVLVEDRPVQRLLGHHQRRGQFHAAALQPILRLAPCADAYQDLGHIRGLFDRDAVDIQQPVGLVDAGIPARAAGFHVQRFHAALPVHPDHAIFGQAEAVLLLKVNERRHAGR